jgi:WhiB family redox-sensing transcriptional regulator
MLALLVLAQPDAPYTARELQHTLNHLQGEQPGWYFERPNTLKDFCDTSLVPAGLAFATKKDNGRPEGVSAYGLTAFGHEMGLPLVGATLDTELKAPFSVRNILSTNNNNSIGAGFSHSPLTRLAILEHLCKNEDQPVSIADLRSVSPYAQGLINRAVEGLAAAEILHVRHKTNPADRTLALEQPTADFTQKELGRMRPELRALHKFLAGAYHEGIRELHGVELLDGVLAKSDEECKRNVLWHIIMHNKPKYLSFSDAGLFGDNKGTATARTRVEIEPTYIAPIIKFLGDIYQIRNDAMHREAMRTLAMQIVTDPVAVSQLLGKARAESPYLVDKNKYAKAVQTRRFKREFAGQNSYERKWLDRAACRDVDPDLFSFINDEKPSDVELAAAKEVCSGCGVSLACLRTAIDTREPHGVWGGRSPEQRRELTPYFAGLLQKLTASS